MTRTRKPTMKWPRLEPSSEPSLERWIGNAAGRALVLSSGDLDANWMQIVASRELDTAPCHAISQELRRLTADRVNVAGRWPRDYPLGMLEAGETAVLHYHLRRRRWRS